MTKVPGVDHQITFIAVDDLEASHRFYATILGFGLVLDQDSCRIYNTGGGGLLGICAGSGRHPNPKGIILTFVTPAVDAWFTYLEEQGVPIASDPTENPAYQIYHFFVDDPDGYTVEFQTFLDPRWQGGNAG